MYGPLLSHGYRRCPMSTSYVCNVMDQCVKFGIDVVSPEGEVGGNGRGTDCHHWRWPLPQTKHRRDPHVIVVESWETRLRPGFSVHFASVHLFVTPPRSLLLCYNHYLFGCFAVRLCFDVIPQSLEEWVGISGVYILVKGISLTRWGHRG